jgi:hypothetical protein
MAPEKRKSHTLCPDPALPSAVLREALDAPESEHTMSEPGPSPHAPHRHPDGIPAEHPHPITYFVNGESETTAEREFTVQAILEGAGFTPAADYLLTSENPPRTFTDQNELVKLHERQRFTAIFKGPTPTS